MIRHHYEELKGVNYEVFILAISLLSIANWALYFILGDQSVLGVIFFVDLLLSLIFLGDFSYRLFTAESKQRYFLKQYGWLDLIGSLPIPQLRIARLGRAVRALIMMRQLGGRNLVHQIFKNRAGTAVYLVAFLIILVLEFGSLAVLAAEHGVPGSNIKTASDAIWWTIVTIATVGYGDFYPVTGMGRLLGIFVITLGVALFGVVTGFLANRFVEPADEPAENSFPGQETVDLELLMSEVKALRREQDRSYSELETKLEGLKALLKDHKANN